MKFLILVLTILSLWLRLAKGVDYLAFDPSLTSNVVYRLRLGTNAGVVRSTIDLGTNRIVGLTNGPWGHYFASVVAVTTNGIESLPSNELFSTNLPSAPARLRLLPPTDALILQSSAVGAGGPWKTLAIVTSTNQPLSLVQSPRQFFRVVHTNLPPLPGGAQ
jgi:hypothetical protein